MKRHTLRHRYGRASHPLLPRLVMYLEKKSPTSFVIRGKLQKHYGGPWKVVVHHKYTSANSARGALHGLADFVAMQHNVPTSHVEFA